MCAIAGSIQFQLPPLPPEESRAVLDTMVRRGPDEEGAWFSPHATLLHRRLSVIDPAGGRQPMTIRDEERQLTIVYNGELYNTPVLREKLRRAGVTLRTHSDTEVLLACYQVWGEDCLSLLEGIFAFAVWDSLSETLFFARDPMGVKPLFFAEQESGFVFASELKSLLAMPGIRPVLDQEGLAELMLLGPGRTPGCGVFRGLREVRPGWCGAFSRQGLRLSRYFVLEDRPHPHSLEETVDTVRELVQGAVRRQLVSDVPLGTFLSGGLDSSVLSALAAREMRERGERLQTFSVTYRDQDRYFHTSRFQPSSDDKYIRLMADFLGSDHHTLTIGPEELTQALFEAVLARDLPGMADVDASLLLFCREIRSHVTVALSGECADELFGGYPWYRDREIRARYGFPWAQSTAYRLGFLRPEKRRQIDGEAYVSSRYDATLADTHCLADRDPEERRMREMTRLNTDWFMQTLLDRKDRMSMYSGLEVRVPFCDKALAEYLYHTPWSFKELDGQEKGLLRRAMEGLLPEEILHRKKSPYPKTHDPHYRSLLEGRLRALLRSGDAPLFSLVEPAALEELLSAQRATPWYGQLMTTPQTIAYLLQLNFWLEAYHVELRL